MRLSEAIMLGAATCVMQAGDMNTCALGAALNAIGVAQGTQRLRWQALCDTWPWTEEYMNRQDKWHCAIYRAFDGPVCGGKMTLEQLVDYVRSIEPDCDCNRFNCDCATKQLVEPEAAHETQTQASR